MQNNENIESARPRPAKATDLNKENGEGSAEPKSARSLEVINEEHISRVDKFYRMYAEALPTSSHFMPAMFTSRFGSMTGCASRSKSSP